MTKIKSVKPLREYVLVRPAASREYRVGSIIVPETKERALLPGEVVSAGAGYVSEDRKRIIPLEVRPGDKILYSEWAGKDVTVAGERLLLMEEEDIQGVIDDGA